MKPRPRAGEFSLEKDGRLGGFSLIELLVTISVISVLAGMLLPALGRAKGQAKTAQRLSSARQLGIAVMLYVGDHRETYPPSSDYSAPTESPERVWPMVVAPYARNGKVFECSRNTAAERSRSTCNPSRIDR